MCIENLALHQPAWLSSTWESNTADRAVDGRYTNLGVYGGQCAASVWGQRTAEWGVDLGEEKSIHHVFIQHAMSESMLVIIYFKLMSCFLK